MAWADDSSGRRGGAGAIRATRAAALPLLGVAATLWLSGVFALDPDAPTNLWGDHLFTAAFAKSFIDGHGLRLNPSLGFPNTQNYLYFPLFETSQRALLWLSAKLTGRPFAAIVVYYGAGLAATYLASVWALRWLGVRGWIAAAASLPYVVSPYLMYRAFGHDFLAMTYAAPMGLALALRLGALPPPGSLGRFLREPFVVAAILVSAGSGIYYAFFTFLFVGFAGAACALSRREWRPAAAGAAVAALMVCVLMVSGFGLDLPTLLRPNPSFVARAPLEQLIYGLDLAGMALPLDALPHVAAGLRVAREAVPAAFGSEGAGNYPGLALTAILALSPLIAVGAGARRDGGVRGDEPAANAFALVAFAAACATLGLLYAARGGLGFVFNLLVSPQIRATARIMPFLSFSALVVAALLAEVMAQSRRRWLRWLGPAGICAALIAASAPLFGGLARVQQRHFQEPYQIAMRASLPRLLAAKERAGLSRILELPDWPWPEAPTPGPRVDQYSPQLPYIFDRPHSPTRWSYGAARGQEGAGLRQSLLAAEAGVAGRARAFGYDAILVLNYAHAEGAPPPFAQLRAEARPGCIVYDDALYTLYALKTGCGPPA